MEQRPSSQQQKNKRTGFFLALGVVSMIGLSFASVPLYNLFCKATGLGGKAEVAKALPKNVLDREITVRFNTDVAPGLPWSFKADAIEMKVKIGEVHKLLYQVKNNAAEENVGISVYNVQPDRAGLYFNKVQCFCFDEQLLKAGQGEDMVVQFFIDPALATDRELKDLTTITLSYTFFSSKNPKLAEAKKKFEDEQSRLIELSKTN